MTFDPHKHHRQSIRLKGYDYALPGAYFVTVCAQERAEFLGNIVNGEMHMNQFGQIVRAAWINLPRHYAHIHLDTFCVMPNHVHGIIVLNEPNVRAGLISQPIAPDGISSDTVTLPDIEQTRPYGGTPKRHPLSEIVRAFKSFSARRINGIRHTRGVPVWQRNYYEHIVRGEEDLTRIRAYILDNPRRWQEDRFHPSATPNHLEQG